MKKRDKKMSIKSIEVGYNPHKNLTLEDCERIFMDMIKRVDDKGIQETETMKLARLSLESKWLNTDEKISITKKCSFCYAVSVKHYFPNCNECLIDKRLCNVFGTGNYMYLLDIIDNPYRFSIPQTYVRDIIGSKDYNLLVKCLIAIREFGFITEALSKELDKRIDQYFNKEGN